MTTNAERWSVALDLFAKALAAEGRLAPSTIARIAKDVGRFGRARDVSPWDVDQALIEAWVEEASTGRHRYVVRTSLRTFYGWAHRSGRVKVNPMEYVSARQRHAEPRAGWAEPIASYRRHQLVAGRSKDTVRMRAEQLVRLSNETAADTPWTLGVEDLVEWMAGHRWARETARQHRATFRSFYGWAVDVGRIEESPAARLPRVALRPPNPRPASEDVYASALAADARTALMARLAGDLGLRRAEIATLHTEDLFQTAGGWWLVVHGKGDRNRALPVGDGLLRQLQALPAGWVFPGRIEGHISPQYAGKLLTRALPDGVTGHALRHRFATKAYAVNRDLFAVQQLLGHASPNTTQAYVKVPEESLRRLVNAVAVR